MTAALLLRTSRKINVVNILGKRLPFQAGFESLLVESRLRWEARNRVQTQRPTCGLFKC